MPFAISTGEGKAFLFIWIQMMKKWPSVLAAHDYRRVLPFECNYSNHQTLKKKKRRVGKHEGDKAAQKKAGNRQKQRCKQMKRSRKREGCKDVKVWRNKMRFIFPSRTWSLRSAAAWSWHTQSCQNSRCHKPERRHERSECLDSKHLTIPA